MNGVSHKSISYADLKHSNGRNAMDMQDYARQAAAYAKCLVFPFDNACFIPDSTTGRSSLFKTKRVFTVSVPNDGLGVGKFAFFVQPKLGSPVAPERYQVGLVNMANGIPEAMGDPASFTLEQNGVPLSMDSNTSIITQPKPSCSAIYVAAPPAAPTPPLTGWVDYQPEAGKNFTYNSPYVVTHEGNDSYINLNQAGSYIVTLQTKTVAASADSLPLFLTVVVAKAGDSVVGSQALLNSYGIASDVQSAVYSVALTSGDRIRVRRTVGNLAVLSRINIFITPLSSPNYGFTDNWGMVEKIRPVAMSVLSTCTMSSLKANGIIAAALVPPASNDKVTGASAWCKPSQLSTFDQYYSGPFKKGSYVWWKPGDLPDREFRQVDAHNLYEFPLIAVCGEIGVDAGLPAGESSAVLKVTVEFVYEAFINNQLFAKRTTTGSQACVDFALQGVGRLLPLSENPDHSTFLGDIAKVMEQGSKFLPLLALL